MVASAILAETPHRHRRHSSPTKNGNVMRSLLVAVGLLVMLTTGCHSTPRPIAPSGRPGNVEGSSRPISGLTGRRILVLSPVSLQQVAPDLTLETTAAPATAGATATGVLQTEDYNLAVSAAERALLDGGWTPVTQAVLARAGRDEVLQGGIATLRRDGQLSPLQVALLLARHAGADLVMLIRLVRLDLDRLVVSCGPHDYHQHYSYVGSTDVVVVAGATGDVVWSGRAQARSLDVLERGTSDACSGGIYEVSPEVFCHRGRCPPRQASRLVERAIALAVGRLSELAGGTTIATSGGDANSSACPTGQERTADTQGQCCWPGQAWSSARARCVGEPMCSEGFLPDGQGGCVPSACRPGQVVSEDTQGQCCWPGQAWSSSRQSCVGEPECPAGMRASGMACE
ncbi:Hypothetical protein I5071_55980 [Sandaracinus amylolyticus]|nr:Hypothetical protein I5071_55980 [Sandaracinus amylolyticus]